jgi:hypothetical protein
MASLCLLACASVFEIGPIANIYFVQIQLPDLGISSPPWHCFL